MPNYLGGGRWSAINFLIFSPTSSTYYNPSKLTLFLLHADTPSTYNKIYGKYVIAFLRKTYRIALQDVNRMLFLITLLT